jgi:hexosaminidase
MPGHALAALAAYPEFACTEGPFEVGMKYGVYEDVFCPKEETFVFLENILAEVMALFPSAVIHIGGDEVLKNRWKSCSHCQALMQAKGLPNEEALQSYFIQRIEKFVNSHGRVIIGWDEILEGGLAPNAMVMSWRGTEGGIAAAKSGHQVVMSPNSDCYFDHYQGDPKNEPLAIGGMTTLQDVYAYEPIPEALTDQEAAFIIGAQANIWTEYILNFDQVEYMAMPRMIALSEVLWSPASSRNFADFRQRLTKNLQLLDQVRVNYSRTWMTQE